MKYAKDLIEIITAFVVAFALYQGLIFVTGTSMPIVSVVSDSMLPILHRGDLLFVVNDDTPQINDIAIYNRAGSQFTIVHRIVEINGEKYIFKGDNNPVTDIPAVSKSQIEGRVVFAAPLLGFPRLALYAVGV